MLDAKSIEVLKDALRRIQARNRRIENRPPRTPYNERQEKVVKGVIEWEPIDKTAALVVSQAPWWAHFNEKTDDKTREKKTTEAHQNALPRKKKKQKARMNPVTRPDALPHREGDVHIYKGAGGEDYFKVSELAPRIIKEMNQHVSELTPLARAAFDARGVLDESLSQIGLSLDEFRAKSKALLDEIRGTRFSIVSETTQMLGPLKELRQFFIGKEYEEEMKRLSEFVSLCERLVELKNSGALDSIADTMVKLSVS